LLLIVGRRRARHWLLRGTSVCVYVGADAPNRPATQADHRRGHLDGDVVVVTLDEEMEDDDPRNESALRCLSTQKFAITVYCRSEDPECHLGGSPTIHGNPVFTDEFSQEYSNDLEPGGQAGDTYYQLLACEVNRRKLTRSNSSGP
jgi:hypothetical protein